MQFEVLRGPAAVLGATVAVLWCSQPVQAGSVPTGSPRIPGGYEVAPVSHADIRSASFRSQGGSGFETIVPGPNGGVDLKLYRYRLVQKSAAKSGTSEAILKGTVFGYAKTFPYIKSGLPCADWLIEPKYSEIVFINQDLVYVRVPGAATLSRFDVRSKKKSATPFVSVDYATSEVWRKRDQRNLKGLGYFGVEPEPGGRTNTISLMAADGSVTARIAGVVKWDSKVDMPYERYPVEALEGGGFVVHRLDEDGHIADQIYTPEGHVASPVLPPIPLFRMEIGEQRSAHLFALETDRQRNLLWPLINPDMIAAKPANLIGMRPVDGQFAVGSYQASKGQNHTISGSSPNRAEPFGKEMWCYDCSEYTSPRTIFAWAALWQTDRGERWAIIPGRAPATTDILDSYANANLVNWSLREARRRDVYSTVVDWALVAESENGISFVNRATGTYDYDNPGKVSASMAKPDYVARSYADGLPWAASRGAAAKADVQAMADQLLAAQREEARKREAAVTARREQARAAMMAFIDRSELSSALEVARGLGREEIEKVVNAMLAKHGAEAARYLTMNDLAQVRGGGPNGNALAAALVRREQMDWEHARYASAQAARDAAYPDQQAREAAAWSTFFKPWTPAIANTGSGPNRTNEIVSEMRWKAQQNYLNGNSSYQVCQSVGGCAR